jgi:hypothetical protein
MIVAGICLTLDTAFCHTVYSYVSYDSDTTEPLFPTATFTDHYSQWEHVVYPVRCSPKGFGGLVLTNPDGEGVGGIQAITVP